ncbi:hypothetical protein AX16_002548 [Volvariella volvacea WC 439]|nr:hypothetical protein AX16_002548 [Volvariella volvacea WC 439]
MTDHQDNRSSGLSSLRDDQSCTKANTSGTRFIEESISIERYALTQFYSGKTISKWWPGYTRSKEDAQGCPACGTKSFGKSRSYASSTTNGVQSSHSGHGKGYKQKSHEAVATQALKDAAHTPRNPGRQSYRVVDTSPGTSRASITIELDAPSGASTSIKGSPRTEPSFVKHSKGSTKSSSSPFNKYEKGVSTEDADPAPEPACASITVDTRSLKSIGINCPSVVLTSPQESRSEQDYRLSSSSGQLSELDCLLSATSLEDIMSTVSTLSTPHDIAGLLASHSPTSTSGYDDMNLEPDTPVYHPQCACQRMPNSPFDTQHPPSPPTPTPTPHGFAKFAQRLKLGPISNLLGLVHHSHPNTIVSPSTIGGAIPSSRSSTPTVDETPLSTENQGSLKGKEVVRA